MTTNHMLTLELDLHLHYSPPMPESGTGIVVTRELRLPFVPHDGLLIFSKVIDDCPDPMGFCIKDVVWDIDREVFLAHTTLSHSGMPIAEIEGDIRGWLDRGWELGSHRDKYEVEYEDDDDEDGPTGLPTEPDENELMQTLPPRKRPKEFNRMFKALIRFLAESYSAMSTAYAMDKLGWFRDFPEYKGGAHRRDEMTPEEVRWREAVNEFEAMPVEQQMEWQDKVLRYRSLRSVLGLPRRRTRKSKARR